MCFADLADKGYFSEPLQNILKDVLKLLAFFALFFLYYPCIFLALQG